MEMMSETGSMFAAIFWNFVATLIPYYMAPRRERERKELKEIEKQEERKQDDVQSLCFPHASSIQGGRYAYQARE